jgi:hypothetical protein
MPGSRVIVRRGVNEAPLLDTTEVQQIEFYDENGELMALVGHVFHGGMWFYSNRNDPDWVDVLARTGFLAEIHPVGSP